MKHKVSRPLSPSFSPYEKTNREMRRKRRTRSVLAQRFKRRSVNLCSGHLRRAAVMWTLSHRAVR